MKCAFVARTKFVLFFTGNERRVFILDITIGDGDGDGDFYKPIAKCFSSGRLCSPL